MHGVVWGWTEPLTGFFLSTPNLRLVAQDNKRVCAFTIINQSFPTDWCHLMLNDPRFGDRKGTTKKLCDKDFAERPGELSGAICLKTLVLLGNDR